jgi:hypothetical protein
MIQRIQTLYFTIALLLVGIPLINLKFFLSESDFGKIAVTSFYDILLKDEPKNLNSNIIWVLQVLICCVLLLTIFSFKNRKRQIQLGWLTFAIHLLGSAWIVVDTLQLKNLEGNASAAITMEMGFFCFVSAFLFIFLGIKGIRKDKALIDSLNRLR